MIFLLQNRLNYSFFKKYIELFQFYKCVNFILDKMLLHEIVFCVYLSNYFKISSFVCYFFFKLTWFSILFNRRRLKFNDGLAAKKWVGEWIIYQSKRFWRCNHGPNHFSPLYNACNSMDIFWVFGNFTELLLYFYISFYGLDCLFVYIFLIFFFLKWKNLKCYYDLLYQLFIKNLSFLVFVYFNWLID